MNDAYRNTNEAVENKRKEEFNKLQKGNWKIETQNVIYPQMEESQIDTMVRMHRYLIKCELNALIHKINKDTEKELIQEEFNDKEWREFSRWFKLIFKDKNA